MHLKLSSAKWRPFCPAGDELMYYQTSCSYLLWSASDVPFAFHIWIVGVGIVQGLDGTTRASQLKVAAKKTAAPWNIKDIHFS